MRVLILFFALTFLSSCKEAVKEMRELTGSTQSAQGIEGKYFSLEKEGIKIFLPGEFKAMSYSNYLDLIKTYSDSMAHNREKENYNTLRKNGYTMYFFEYLDSGSILKIATEKYIPFNENDARYLMSYINEMRRNNPSFEKNDFEKIEASFRGNKDIQIFKSLYKIINRESQAEYFNQIYFVSFNKKSFFLTLDTPFPVDFDPYLDKIRIL